MLRFGDPVRFWMPWLPRFGALEGFLGRPWDVLGRPCGAAVLLGALGALLVRFGVALGALGLLLGALEGSGVVLAVLGAFLAGSIKCKQTFQRLPHRHD